MDAVGVDPNVDEALQRLADDECGDVDEDDDGVLEIEVPAGVGADSHENDPENIDATEETNPAPQEFDDSKAHWNTVLGATSKGTKAEVTVEVLKQYCRAAKLPVSGKKAELLGRVFAHKAYGITPESRKRGKKKVTRGDNTLKINYEQLKYFSDLFTLSFDVVRDELEVMILNHHRTITRKETVPIKVRFKLALRNCACLN